MAATAAATTASPSSAYNAMTEDDTTTAAVAAVAAAAAATNNNNINNNNNNNNAVNNNDVVSAGGVGRRGAAGVSGGVGGARTTSPRTTSPPANSRKGSSIKKTTSGSYTTATTATLWSRQRDNNNNNPFAFASFHDRNQDLSSLKRMDRWAMPIVGTMIVVTIFSWMPPYYLLQPFAIPLSFVLMIMWIVWLMVASMIMATNTLQSSSASSAAAGKNYHPSSSSSSSPIIRRRRCAAPLHILTLFIMTVFVGCSAFPPRQHLWLLVLAAIAICILLLQVTLLVWTIWSSPPAETDIQEAYFASLNVVYAIATLTSLIFLSRSVQDWASPIWSFCSALASYFCLAYASLVASLVTGPRGKSGLLDSATIFSCDAVVSVGGRCCCCGCCMTNTTRRVYWWTAALAPIATHSAAALALVYMWPPPSRKDTNQWIMGGLLPALWSAQAYVMQRTLLSARRFHVKSDGSVLVETLCKTYVYDKAVQVHLEEPSFKTKTKSSSSGTGTTGGRNKSKSKTLYEDDGYVQHGRDDEEEEEEEEDDDDDAAGCDTAGVGCLTNTYKPGSPLPKQSATCHVYCAKVSVPRVVIELEGGGRWLHLTPQRPVEFTNAIIHAMEESSTV